MAESMSLSQKVNPRSPYYVNPDYQPDENLPMVILNQAGDNYFIWNNHFLEFLGSKNKTRVKSWMMNSVSENFRNYVHFAETAHKAWEDLRTIFVPNVDMRIYQLRQRIAMCEITERAKEAREKEQLTAFVMGLDKDLSYVTTHIMLMDPSPSVDQAYVVSQCHMAAG
ncbi:unnamed protein product [Brassica rapa]|uniref:Retrotransposon Copia-like N-terminal domain-containing protein n=1 Tax=Brassica campestris TaxID=3711 RepID=A0A8D9HHS5_BRACM|nr:unnamed protein product [Brassica rapa]